MRGTRFILLSLLLVLSSCSTMSGPARPNTTATASASGYDRLLASNQELSREVTALRQKVIWLKHGIADRRAQRIAFWKSEQRHEHIMVKDNLGHVLLFRSGYMELTPQDRKDIKDLAAQLKSTPGIKSIDVLGYTDAEPIGGYPKHRHKKRHPYKTNLALSQGRANAVAKIFIAAGFPGNMVHAKGLGTVSTRRVEIYPRRN